MELQLLPKTLQKLHVGLEVRKVRLLAGYALVHLVVILEAPLEEPEERPLEVDTKRTGFIGGIRVFRQYIAEESSNHFLFDPLT